MSSFPAAVSEGWPDGPEAFPFSLLELSCLFEDSASLAADASSFWPLSKFIFQ